MYIDIYVYFIHGYSGSTQGGGGLSGPSAPFFFNISSNVSTLIWLNQKVTILFFNYIRVGPKPLPP